MAKGGAFKDIDYMFAWHPRTMNMALTGNSTAINIFVINYLREDVRMH